MVCHKSFLHSVRGRAGIVPGRNYLKNWILGISVAGNLFVLVYLRLYSTSTSSSPNMSSTYVTNNPPSADVPVSSGLHAASINNLSLPASPLDSEIGIPEALQPVKPIPESNQDGNENAEITGRYNNNSAANIAVAIAQPEVNSEVMEDEGEAEPRRKKAKVAESEGKGNVLKSNKLFPCDDLPHRSYYGQRGNYWILYNYVKASRTFLCDQSLTYTTHADWTYLDNLVPLLERWQGPLSLALYSPGTDFEDTLKRIQFLRECGVSPLVKELVTFHLFFDQRNVPKLKIPPNPEKLSVNCSALANNVSFGKGLRTYKKVYNLSYPVNVARNVAREMATTHYVLPSDIELYPNPNLIRDFLEMIRVNDTVLQRPAPKVFVLSVFEVEANVTALPYDKRDLIYMLHNKSAIPFHKDVCADCHRIPKAEEWLKAPFQPILNVFHIGKRYKPFQFWEPFFICTKFDPMYDERLSWEGKRDKMTQGYILCVKDYEFLILNNGFLLHRPGIKRFKPIPEEEYAAIERQNTLIDGIIQPELSQIYGTRSGCFV